MKPEELGELKATVSQLNAVVDRVIRVQETTSQNVGEMAKSLAEHIASVQKFEVMRADDHRRMDGIEKQLIKQSNDLADIKEVSTNNKFIAGMTIKVASVIFTAFMAGGIGVIWAMFKMLVEPLVKASGG